MAQFRELAAFAQFASDLDPQTKARIESRLAELTEVLKQKQYEPMSVEHQAMILYAVTNNFLENVAVEDVKDWEYNFP
jgi:F-type H+-transporting ATPase subunit alpha